MKFRILLFITLFILSSSVVSSKNRKAYKYNFNFAKLEENVIPDFLRKGIKADIPTLRKAVELHLQGWEYNMPRPKSIEAKWGNKDDETTWWYGYWYNTKTYQYSNTIPKKNSNGIYVGDGYNLSGGWRSGGSPVRPSKIEWLLSDDGGVKPHKFENTGKGD